LAVWDILFSFTEDDWKQVIEKWRLVWEENKDRIEWDDKGRFFKINSNELKNCLGQRVDEW
jgi:hypothetical protein